MGCTLKGQSGVRQRHELGVELTPSSGIAPSEGIFKILSHAVNPPLQLPATRCEVVYGVPPKIFKIIPSHPETEIMYVRYFLVYRLWKRIHSNLAVKKQINANAFSSLSVPTSIPVKLLEQVLPNTATSVPVESKSTRFYLFQAFDLRKACSQFLDFCKQNKGNEGTNSTANVIEKDSRIINTLTSEANKSENNKFSNSKISLDKSNSLNTVNNIPKIDKSDSVSIVNSNDSHKNKNLVKPTILSKRKKSTKKDEIILIDLTGPQVTKIFRHKNRRKISWLEDAKRSIDAKIKEAAQKRNQSTDEKSVKITENHLEDTTKISTNIEHLSVEQSKCESLHSSTDVKMNSKNFSNDEDKQKDVSNSFESQIKTKQSNSSPLNSSTSEPIYFRDEALKEPFNDIKKSSEDCSIEVINHLTSTNVVSSTVPKLEEENEQISALRDDYSLTKDTPANAAVLKEICPVKKDTFIDSNSHSVICTLSSNVTAQTSVIAKVHEKKLLENNSVNSSITKTDYNPNEQKVQQTLIKEDKSLSSSKANHSNVEKNLEKKEDKSVNSDQTNIRSNVIQINEMNQEKRITELKIDNGLQADKSEVINSTSEFYNIQDSEIDGLTLLAKISAQLQQVPSSKKNELKVKPYSSLQQKPKEDNAIINNIVGMNSENTLDNIDFQVEVSSPKLVSNNVSKYQHQDVTPSELLPYVLDENMQYHFESNDNANVILNGETIMLMQKSPNSNLYIINKAAVDNISGSKFNYNSDEEEKLVDPEDIKYSQQGIILKHEMDDGLRNRIIKQDPDFIDVKSSALIHEESKLQNQSQNYDLHYSGYSVPPANYCTYPNIHHPSTACACVNCAYCRPMPYYLPTTHATQLVQTNPTVQEKRNSKKTEAQEKLAKIYNDQLICNVEKNLPSTKQQVQTTVEEQKTTVSRFEHVDSKLPLKKRLKAQMMANFDNPKKGESPLKNEIVTNTYPGMLMLSIADVEERSEHTPLDLGADIEVTSATVKPTENHERVQDKKIKNANNQNVPNCFPRKNNGKKRRLYSTDEEIENGTTLKKSRKSNTGEVKQTRSSRRIVPTVTYVYPDIDPECNPSAKRRKRRNNR